MGEVIQLKVELTEQQFLERWKRECDEWTAISKELQDTGQFRASHSPGREHEYIVTAYDVSEEQRARMRGRNEMPMDMARIWITGHGWLIER